MIKQLQSTLLSIRKYNLDYIQRNLQHVLLRLGSVFDKNDRKHEEISTKLSNLILQSGLNQFDQAILPFHRFLQWLRNIQQRICGKSAASEGTARPLPIENVPGSEVLKFLKEHPLDETDAVGSKIQDMSNQFSELHNNINDVFSMISIVVSSDFNINLSNRLRTCHELPKPDSWFTKDDEQFLLFRQDLYIVIVRMLSDMILETCTIELHEHLSECHKIEFYGQDSLFCVGIVHVEEEINRVVKMLTISLEQVVWVPFHEYGECFMNGAPASIIKERDIYDANYNVIQSVAVGTSRGLASVVLSASEGRTGNYLYLFDLEDDEEEEQVEEEQECVDGDILMV
ncbi:hypothetical protein AKO1_006897 [Acrasis kona]|uniref:Anaphase-promoting complex subunit 4 n=1 Tax=Acrasis kona TaxID=1008807 RepID=A0AAW2YU20_9EUKA